MNINFFRVLYIFIYQRIQDPENIIAAAQVYTPEMSLRTNLKVLNDQIQNGADALYLKPYGAELILHLVLIEKRLQSIQNLQISTQYLCKTNFMNEIWTLRLPSQPYFFTDIDVTQINLLICGKRKCISGIHKTTFDQTTKQI